MKMVAQKRRDNINTNVIYHQDCIEGMKQRIPDNSIDLIVTDPPYNIGKDDWDKIDNYIEWCGKWLHQCERTLKDNGSFYFFHNDFEVLAELQNWIRENTDFIFKQLIVWNKRFEGASNKGFLDGFVEVNKLRNYQKMAEYCLFYTFDDETGLKQILNDKELFPDIREYFWGQRKQVEEMSYKEINKKILGTASNGGGMASNILNPYKKNWNFPTKDQYLKFRKIGICKKPYNELEKKYKQKKKEYEKIKNKNEKENRYTFNNQKTHHSVWNHEIAEKKEHITPKPLPMIENIIKHSSNEGDIVLDCFGGSGTTAKACQNLNRQYILFEKKEEYVEMAKDRLRQQSLFANIK